MNYRKLFSEHKILRDLSLVQFIAYFGAWFSNVAIYTMLVEFGSTEMAISMVTAMHFLDNGIRSFAGSILRLEAHAQNEAAFSPAEDKTELSRFGDMSFAWMLQVLMPLFIILLCFNAVNADRENQNLKLF